MQGRRLLFWLFARVYAVSQWLRSRFTLAGRTLLILMLAAAALGLDTRQNILHQAFALLGATLLVAMLVGWWFPARFSIQRFLPGYATVGEPIRYHLHIHNPTRRIQRGLLARDLLQRKPITTAHYLRTGAAADALNWFDRRVGYPRWSWLMRRQMGARISDRPVPDLAPGDTRKVEFQTTPLRRGYLNFHATHIARPDPLGLFLGLLRYPSPQRLLVLPRRYPVRPLPMPGNRRYQPGGVQLAVRVGDSQEFIGLRDYRPGDPRKHIHWRSWARSGRPTVKQFHDEYLSRKALILDTWSNSDTVFEAAVSVAASLAASQHGPDVVLDLMFAGPQVVHLSEGRGLGGTDQLLEALACVEPGKKAEFQQLRERIQQHRPQLSACVLVLQDWDQARQDLVSSLQKQQLPLWVIRVHGDARQAGAPENLPQGPGIRYADLDATRLREGLAGL